MVGLASAIAWFEIGIAIAAGRVLAWGADPEGWSIELIAGPLLLGWVGLAVLASATHLIPAIGPGDPATHGRQRTLLGRAATGRLVALDAGIAALSVGVPLRLDPLVVGGALAAVGGFVATAIAAGGGDRPARIRRAIADALTPADREVQADGPSSSESHEPSRLVAPSLRALPQGRAGDGGTDERADRHAAQEGGHARVGIGIRWQVRGGQSGLGRLTFHELTSALMSRAATDPGSR